MKSFVEFYEERSNEKIAYCLLELGIDVDQFCETILTIAKQGQLTEDTIPDLFCGTMINLMEAQLGQDPSLGSMGRNQLGGIGNLAAPAAGVGNVLGWMGRGLWNKAKGAGQAAGGWLADKGHQINQGWQNMKQSVGNKAQQAWDATGGAAVRQGQQAAGAVNRFGGQIADKYHQGANAQNLRKAANAVSSLKQQLQGLGYQDQLLDQGVNAFMNILQQDFSANQANTGYKIGSGNYGSAPAAPAAAATA